jgi:hypothetical protein
MEVLLSDFIDQMRYPASFNAVEILRLIKETRVGGNDVWLLDENNNRVAIVVLTENGIFRAQDIVQPSVV